MNEKQAGFGIIEQHINLKGFRRPEQRTRIFMNKSRSNSRKKILDRIEKEKNELIKTKIEIDRIQKENELKNIQQNNSLQIKQKEILLEKNNLINLKQEEKRKLIKIVGIIIVINLLIFTFIWYFKGTKEILDSSTNIGPKIIDSYSNLSNHSDPEVSFLSKFFYFIFKIFLISLFVLIFISVSYSCVIFFYYFIGMHYLLRLIRPYRIYL